jgi:PAS domain S-box-containing protein
VLLLSGMTVWMLVANWRQSVRRQAQQALQAETSFRRAMENSMLTGMRALDLQGRITYVNPAFCQMTGWREEELLGQTEPFTYWPNEDHDQLAARLTEELGGAADRRLSDARQAPDGSVFDARLYVSPLIDATGKQTGWMASMTDITEPNRVRGSCRPPRALHHRAGGAGRLGVGGAAGQQELLFANKLYRQWFGATTEGHLKLVLRGGTANTLASDESLDAVDSFVGLPLDTWPPRRWPSTPRSTWSAGQVAGGALALPQLGGRAPGADGDRHRHHRAPPGRGAGAAQAARRRPPAA